MKTKRIVVIGGGSGSYAVLRGIKRYPFDISAVVNTFDSGGSSGVLKSEFGILPPGDVRRCLVALTRSEAEDIFGSLFNLRFSKDSSLNGHNFGNIFLAALMQVLGNSVEAINFTGRILHIRGRVLPVSLGRAELCAVLEGGEIITGEKNIDVPKHDGNLRIVKVFLDRPTMIYDEAREAILNADMIVIGPGDLYTSIIPNFLVSGVAKAIRESRASKIYVANLMTKWGETNQYTAADYAREILRYTGLKKLDYIICNNRPFSPEISKLYKKEVKHPVLVGKDIKHYARRVLYEDLYTDPDNDQQVLRHDPDKLAAVIGKIAFSPRPILVPSQNLSKSEAVFI